MTTNDDDFAHMLTPKQVSDILGIPVTAVWKRMERGHIPTYQKHPRARQSYLKPEEVRRVYPRLPDDVG